MCVGGGGGYLFCYFAEVAYSLLLYRTISVGQHTEDICERRGEEEGKKRGRRGEGEGKEKRRRREGEGKERGRREEGEGKERGKRGEGQGRRGRNISLVCTHTGVVLPLLNHIGGRMGQEGEGRNPWFY